MALKRAIKAILKPPSLTIRARQPYCRFVFSSFSPRARQQYLKALHMGTVGWIMSAYTSQGTDHALKVAQFSKKCASGNNSKSNPKTPNNATKDGNNFVTEELWYI